MFSSGPNYNKLKTNLRLAINRLKLLEKKKTELTQKARKEIADYIATGKRERAKIRVEHIIREDYLVEAMEVTEMYCDLLLARYGLIQQMKDLDEGMAEAISSLIWAAPRLQTDVAELKIIAEQLTLKYGKPYAMACQQQQVQTISERLIHKLGVQAPPKVLVEKYLIEIAKNYNVEYEPDPQILREDQWGQDPLINLDDLKNNLDGPGDGSHGGASGGGGSNGGMGYPPQPGFVGFLQHPPMPQQPFAYPSQSPPTGFEFNLPNVPGHNSYSAPATGCYNIPNSGPPPPDLSADTLPSKVNNLSNMQNFSGGADDYGNSKHWNELMDNSPPPPYTSMTPSGHTAGIGGHMPTAPAPSLPTSGSSAQYRQFPPDMHGSFGNYKESDQPKPAPRSKFGEEDNDFNLPDLPSVPDQPGINTLNQDETNKDDIDFDDLTRRFEDLKKKK